MQVLYRADKRDGLALIRGCRSWTSSQRHAEQYQVGFYGSAFGGPYLYRAEIKVPTDGSVIDLRNRKAASAVQELLEDLFDIAGVESPAPFHGVVRDGVPLLRAHGATWVIFNEYDRRRRFDEWLYLGQGAIPVRQVRNRKARLLSTR